MNPRTGQTGHDSDHDPQFGKTTLISERDFPKPRIIPPHPEPWLLDQPRGVRECGQAPAVRRGKVNCTPPRLCTPQPLSPPTPRQGTGEPQRYGLRAEMIT